MEGKTDSELGRKDRHELPEVWLYTETWTVRALFLDGCMDGCFVPEVRKYVASRECLIKF